MLTSAGRLCRMVLLPGFQQHIASIFIVTSNTRPGIFSKMRGGLEVKDIFNSLAFPSYYWVYRIVFCTQKEARRNE